MISKDGAVECVINKYLTKQGMRGLYNLKFFRLTEYSRLGSSGSWEFSNILTYFIFQGVYLYAFEKSWIIAGICVSIASC